MDFKLRASMGGKARAAKLSKEERSESARKAVNARWSRYYKCKVVTFLEYRCLVDGVEYTTKECYPTKTFSTACYANIPQPTAITGTL